VIRFDFRNDALRGLVFPQPFADLFIYLFVNF